MKKFILLLMVLFAAGMSVQARHSIYISKQIGYDQVGLYAYSASENDVFGGWPGIAPSASVQVSGMDFDRFDIADTNNGKTVTLIYNNYNNGSQLGDLESVTLDRDRFMVADNDGLREYNILYVENRSGWSAADLHVYAYQGKDEPFGGWPGAQPAPGSFEKDGKSYLAFVIPSANAGDYSLIFNNGNSGDGNQFNYDSPVALNSVQYITAGDGEPGIETPVYQSSIYLTGGMNNWQLGASLVQIPHVGDGVYSRKFTSPADFSGEQMFKISTLYTDNDWAAFDAAVLQPALPSQTNATQSYTVGFNQSNISIPECPAFTVTVDMANRTIRVDLEFTANMPLKPEDFNNGNKYYFLVGSRSNDFRLQPEWMFAPADGKLVIENRLMYPGMFAIAMVDNYTDYIYHRFKIYALIDNDGNGHVVTKDNYMQPVTFAGDNGTAVCITTDDYKARRLPYNYEKADGTTTAMLFNWRDARGRKDIANEILLGWAVLANRIELTLNADGTPAQLLFADVTDNQTQVAARRMFAPCGENIYYADNSVFDPTKGTTYWRIDDTYFHTTDHWANSWIQYDENHRPYVDGYGRYMAQTVYQYAAWMKDHPTYFQYPVVGEMKAMPYSSSDIVFVHYSQLDPSDPYYEYYLSKVNTDDPAIGNGVVRRSGDLPEGFNPWFYNEELYTFDSDGITPRKLDAACGEQLFRESTSWQPYVASDLWLYGEFKIWSGTSGGPRYQALADMKDDYNYNDLGTDFLWYPQNGGVDLAQNTAGSVNPTYIYRNADGPVDGVFYTVGQHDSFNNYNFDGAPRYFKRVILWYDPIKGLGNSLIQFLGRYFAPTIQISHDSDSEYNYLSYHWNLPIEESANGSAYLTHYTIERYLLNEESGKFEFHGYATRNGSEVKDVPVNGDAGHLISQLDFATLSGRDETMLPTGTYFYKVKTKVHDTTNGKNDILDREAESPQAYFVGSNPNTGVDDIAVDAAADAVYYDMRGIRVDNPVRGTYIEVRGGKARKVNVR